MSATAALAPEPTASPRADGGAAWNLEAIALFAYFTRDLMAGAARYYLAILGLGPLWLIPDILGGLCLLAFVRRTVVAQNDAAAALTVLYTAFSLGLGLIVLGNAAAAASAFKMILPVFVGFCFCGRALGAYHRLLGAIHVLFYVAVAGVLLTAFGQMPWVGFKFEAFGMTREAGRVWWASDDGLRLSGFSADSTMAGFFVMITFALAAIRRGLLWCLLFGALAIYATVLTTSKTSLIVIVVYLAALVVVRALPPELRFPAVRRLGLASFGLIFVPVVLMALCSGIDLVEISPTLFSMQDRINNSWQLPFVHMLRIAPPGYLIGCGLGCFNYPQEIFAPQLADFVVPVDNFYLGTYLMMGVPALLFFALGWWSLRRSGDVYRLSLAFVLNLFTITVLGYGPASTLVAMGVVYGEVFARRGGAHAASAPVPARAAV